MLCLAPLLLCASTVLAQTMDGSAVMAEGWLTVQRPAQLRTLEQTIGLTIAEGRRKQGSRLQQRVLVSPRAAEALRARGYELTITRSDHRLGSPSGSYRSPAEGQRVLEALAKTSDRADTAVIGTSTEGRPIAAMWLGVDPSEGAPVLRVLGAHHGDEWSSFEVALALAEALVALDGDDADITALLDTHTIWLVPYVNPDGVMAGSRYSANAIDLNRNYDLQWSSRAYRSGEAPFSEPETRAVRTHALWTLPHASLSLHSGAVNIGYVWNYTTEEVPDLAEVEALASVYAEDCTAEGFYVTNGADWYITYGDTNDWSYGRYAGLDYTVELTNIKAPEDVEITGYVAAHLQSLLSFLLEAAATAQLTVLDLDGAPVAARVVVDEQLESATLATSGRWARASSGHRVDLSAPGFESRTLVLEPGQTLVTLEPEALWSAGPLPRRVQGPTTLTLPDSVADGELMLWRPGGTPLALEVTGGEATLDPTGMAPGLWSLWHEDGSGLPNALWIDTEAVLRFTSASTVGDTLTLTGSGWTEGTRAFAVEGAARSLREVPVEETGSSLILDLSSTGSLEPTDVVVVSNGTEEVVLDVNGSPWIDTGVAPDTAMDTGPAGDEPPCGCRTGGLAPVGLLWMLPLLRRRRE